MKPKRIQRKRIKGWRKPKNTLCVDRSTPFGNPFKVGVKYTSLSKIATQQDAVNLFKQHIELFPKWKELIKEKLKGKDLACFCSLDDPCHADILLEIANK